MSAASLIKRLALLSYCCIMVQGYMIMLPWGFLLFTGLFEGEPLHRFLIALADLSLIGLFILSFYPKTKQTFLFECIAYLLLLLPVVTILLFAGMSAIHDPFFMVPFVIFVIGYLVALLLAQRNRMRQ